MIKQPRIFFWRKLKHSCVIDLRMKWHWGLWALLISLFCVRAAEVQKHGLSFEHWVADTFFEGYRPQEMTQKWDIPALFNKDYGGVPVNPKATKFGTAVGMGDALRQYDIKEPFLLIVGFWKQVGDTKVFVQSFVKEITPEKWHSLWGKVTREELEALDRLVKDHALSIPEARREALKIKSQPPFSEAVIQVNPKIDRAQRRLQCSIPYKQLFKALAPGVDFGEQETATVFGKAIPAVEESQARQFREK